MTVPLAVRDAAAVAGALLVLTAAVSVIGTVIIPRKTGSRLTRLADRAVSGAFRLITRPARAYELRDRLAGQLRAGRLFDSRRRGRGAVLMVRSAAA
jgi:hypothetical protein